MTKRHGRIGLAIVIAAIATATVLAWVLESSGAFVRGLPALLVYGWTESGGSRFVPLVLAAALAAWATDRDQDPSRRRREAWVAFLLLAAMLPVTALVNEFVLKPAVRAPRPSHQRLVVAGIIPDLDAFYGIDRPRRAAWLQARLSEPATAASLARLDLHPVVLRQWVRETGYSFPSSHAMNAFAAATLLLGGALVHPTPRRRRIVGIMLVWAIGVGLSRVVLLVHRPLDVTAGAAAGAGLGALLLLPWEKWTRDRDQKSI